MKKPDWKFWLKNKAECGDWLKRYIKNGILRKTNDESRLHLRKTDHNITFANWVFEKHKDEIPKLFEKEAFYDWTINIYYYAALALINREGYKSASHSATLCFLIYHHCLAESFFSRFPGK